MAGLTPKQRRFVDEYMIDLNATAAAKRAGYSARTAEWQGPQLLGKTHVAEARDDGRRVNWTPSLGHDPRGREAVLQAAFAAGRLSFDHASDLCPALPAPSADVIELLGNSVKRVTA